MLGLLWAVVSAVPASHQVVSAEHTWHENGVFVDIKGENTLRVNAEVGSDSSFRLGVEFLPAGNDKSSVSGAIASPQLDSLRSKANFTKVDESGLVGIETSFGALLIDKDGKFLLRDAAGKTVAQAGKTPSLSMDGDGSITMPVTGSKTGPGATGRRPCMANGIYDPQYHWDPVDKFFAFAISPWEYDTDHLHCYPISFDGAVPASHQVDACTTITYAQPDYASSILIASIQAPSSHSACCAECNANPNCTAWQYLAHPGSKNSSEKNCQLFSCVGDWTISEDERVKKKYLVGGVLGQCPGSVPPPKTSHQDGWWGKGWRIDWYLSPTPRGGFDFTRALYDLTGAPAVPPLFGMGFMATYWGYKSMQEVEADMRTFRDRRFPIDSFIMDYDWFGPDPCGPSKDAQGGTNCGDSGYRRSFWANQTFTWASGSEATVGGSDGGETGAAVVGRRSQNQNHTVFAATPADVLAHFHADPLHMRFAGIRKPRTYSNLAMSTQKGWLLPNGSDVGEGPQNWNFSRPDLREWYIANHLHFIEDGMDFWWNDEGETAWLVYLYWNMAQAEQYATGRPNIRHFTVNRAWTPGMQRFPAVAWTGDGQDCSHHQLLQSLLSGCPYTTCDLSAVFNPIMRVHQMGGTPRFPWLWGGAEHQTAFRAALDMRYRFLPFLYSLAHTAHRHAKPIAAPASWSFPAASASEFAELADTYMVGEVLIPSDLGLSHSLGSTPPSENASSAYLPSASRWYRWNSSAAPVAGGARKMQQVALDEMVVFVRAGAILPLHMPNASRSTSGADNTMPQHSEQAVGGMLTVQVYAGADGAFEMVEDDGISLDYQASTHTSTRTTVWSWDDERKTLSWSVTGSYTGKTIFTSMQAMLFRGGEAAVFSAANMLDAGGKVTFS